MIVFYYLTKSYYFPYNLRRSAPGIAYLSSIYSLHAEMAEPEQYVILPQSEVDHRVSLRVDGQLVNPTELCQSIELLQHDQVCLLEFKVLQKLKQKITDC